jgi:hypothetical protein
VRNKDMNFKLKGWHFWKNVGKTKVVHDMSHLGKKEGEWYVNKKCNHAKNEVAYLKRSTSKLLSKYLKGRVEKQWGRKRKWFIKFAIIICHMGPKLQQGQSMLEFKALKSLFSFLNVSMLLKNE